MLDLLVLKELERKKKIPGRKNRNQETEIGEKNRAKNKPSRLRLGLGA